jgi:chromosome segregation ATPase
MTQDDLDHIPAIVPGREREREPAGTGARPRNPRGASSPGKGSGGRADIWGRIFVAVALVAAAVACAWAWQLQARLEQSQETLSDYAQRIGDLEDRLSDTDEGMNENAAVQAARIKELAGEAKRLDSEVRKLWDNVWKQAKQRLASLEGSSKRQAGEIDALQASVGGMESQVESAAGDIAKLKSVAGDLERLMAGARTNQAEVERVADELNRINLEFAKLSKRVEGNEEWVESINAFRRQMNAAIADVKASLRALQSGP